MTAGAKALADGRPGPSAYAGILFCSLAVLMQEILLTRIFSLTIWYHFAYLTISTALLGFGAAGSLLAARPALVAGGAARLASRASAAAGVALVLAVAVLGPNPVDPVEITRAPVATFAALLAYYVVVTVPFFSAGLAVATPLAAYPARANRLYATDLLGAGLGCACAVLALTWIDGAGAIFVCAAVFLVAACCYAEDRRERAAFGIVAVALTVAAPAADRVVSFLPSESKVLGAALRDPKTELLFTQWSPVNRVDVFEPSFQYGGWWGTFGVADDYEGKRPPVLEIQYDGHNGTSVYQAQDDALLGFLDRHVLRTPYVIEKEPRVMIIGLGGGVDLLNALRRGARRVVAVDLQPITIALHDGMLAEWTGGKFQRPEVELVASEGRHFVRTSDDVWDVIQITAVDTFSAQTTGAYVLAESYLYTVEAFRDYLAHLSDDGVISLVIGDTAYQDRELPTPLSTRLALTARAALEADGAQDPRLHMLIVAKLETLGQYQLEKPELARGVYAQNLLVKKRPFKNSELERIQRFVRANGFSLHAWPRRQDTPTGRIVQAERPALAQSLADQPFVLDPVTDDDPFFFSVLPWASLFTGERIAWLFPGSTTGQLMLVMMLAQAIGLGGLLILAPLRGLDRGRLPRGRVARYLLYFLGLGVGFLLIEISFVQKYVLLLGYPTYSLSVTIFSLLVFAALGSYLSQRWFGDPARALRRLLAATVVLVALEIVAMPLVRDASLGTPLWTRIAITILLQLPLGVTLGTFFPTGLEVVRRVEPRLVPWAWAVNGVGSVLAAVLAVILAMQIGFAGVAAIAVGVYAVGTLALLSTLRRSA